MKNFFQSKSVAEKIFVSFSFVLKLIFVLFFFQLTMTGYSQIAKNLEEKNYSEFIITDSLFRGLCYGPHRDNQDPDFGVQPKRSEMVEDLAFIKNLTPVIRTYGATDNLELIPILCDSIGIDCYPGAWISKYLCENDRQVDNIIKVGNLNLGHVKGLIVGNEVLLRNDVSIDQLIAYIEKVKDSTNLPVASAEIASYWLMNSQLAEAVDIMFVHIYPYWDEIAVEDAADYVLQRWNELKAVFPGKQMVIGETGWPSKGEIHGAAIPSEENQKLYIADFIAMAEDNDIDYFYFEVFNEKWKLKEGISGINWGMYLSDGSLKPHLIDCIPASALDDTIIRLPGIIDTIEASLPVYVYHDGCDTLNRFFASGWMGELADIFNDTITSPTQIIDESHPVNPYSGETCIRISYNPSPPLLWGGIYWQFRVNNWGNYPGYNFSNSLSQDAKVKLSFWARGKNGGEKAQFKSGGIINSPNDTLHPYSDSYGPIIPVPDISPGISILSQEWQLYTIDLTGKDLSMVLGGFCWVTNHDQNPLGATIFLDEILFEVDNDGDGYFSEQDCDDNDANNFPGNIEVCDGQDNNCNGLLDDQDPTVTGQGIWFADIDGDGFGDLNKDTLACNQPMGFVSVSIDCDDNDANNFPGNIEVCDGQDNNCNGLLDDQDPTVTGQGIWFADIDGDGFGGLNNDTLTCNQPFGFVSNNTDCDDNTPINFPGNVEICDGQDNNCNGIVDENFDLDGDGITNCEGDCDDSDSNNYPGNAEVCDGQDNDCDGLIDDADTDLTGQAAWYADTDGDGFGNVSSDSLACIQPSGFVPNNTDCDDSDSNNFPGNAEVCDGQDNDCDGLIDDADTDIIGQNVWYVDIDGDGFGDVASDTLACIQPSGFVYDSTDCNDFDSTSYPDAEETPNNGIDEDCDGADSTTNVNETRDNPTFFVFPNPATTTIRIEINIQHSLSSWEFEVFNLMGKRVFSQTFAKSSEIWERGNLLDGMYLFRIVTKERVLGTGKLILEK